MRPAHLLIALGLLAQAGLARALPVDPQRLYPLVQAYLGVPYRWGGTDPQAGLDCSSFTQRIYAHLGWRIPRTALEQWERLAPVRTPYLLPGDLVFFTAPGRAVDHVGLVLWNGLMAHASYRAGRVVVEPIAAYRTRYIGARRPLGNRPLLTPLWIPDKRRGGKTPAPGCWRPPHQNPASLSLPQRLGKTSCTLV